MGQFVGDEVLALFGVPEPEDNVTQRALECARALLQIGNSVSNRWQRQLDRVQPAGGVHLGIAMGDIHVGCTGRSARPTSAWWVTRSICRRACWRRPGPTKWWWSNTFYQKLPEAVQAEFSELEPIEAKNVGLIKAWKLHGRSRFSTRGA